MHAEGISILIISIIFDRHRQWPFVSSEEPLFMSHILHFIDLSKDAGTNSSYLLMCTKIPPRFV